MVQANCCLIFYLEFVYKHVIASLAFFAKRSNPSLAEAVPQSNIS